ncbi:MAG TPA: hypothetical protein VKU82_15945 [Planctomycetaceae bacterium]|nr:hypothetical protein [Planctomycetaceae bacterium]
METKLRVEILPQPDDFTCGPTCLHALYRYFGDELPLDKVVAEVPMLQGGGTLDVLLANHALARGYSACVFTYNVQMFDPTWFDGKRVDLAERLSRQLEHKDSPRLRVATEAYLLFLERGGELRFEELTTALIGKYLSREIPILTGLSATYLYRSSREYGPSGRPDDVRGKPAGHFVLLCGYDKNTREVLVADPLVKNPLSQTNYYLVSIDRVIGAILLGILTYDANFMIIQPRRKRKQQGRRADSHRRQ